MGGHEDDLNFYIKHMDDFKVIDDGCKEKTKFSEDSKPDQDGVNIYRACL